MAHITAKIQKSEVPNNCRNKPTPVRVKTSFVLCVSRLLSGIADRRRDIQGVPRDFKGQTAHPRGSPLVVCQGFPDAPTTYAAE